MIQDNNIAINIIRQQEAIAGDRVNFETRWREINDYVSPNPDIFVGNYQPPGQTNTTKLFDSTATLALNRFAAAMESMLTPRTQKWHGLRVVQKDVQDNYAVKEWLDETTEILFSVRYDPRANFASQTYECYLNLGKYGTAALFTDEEVGSSLRYKSIPLSELYITENHVGQVNSVYRRFRYTAQQAISAFGIESMPQSIKGAAARNSTDLFEFIHGVYENKNYNPNLKDPKAMKYSSCYVLVDGKQLIRESGYRTFPYAVSRYVTNANEVYGRSPAMDVINDIKILNEYIKHTIQAAQFQVKPPLLSTQEGLLKPFDLRPGAVNYGGLDASGNPVIRPLSTASNFEIAQYLIDDKRKIINDTFLVTLFQILVQNQQMTATEAMYRQQEKGALLAPAMGRQQSEMLRPMIERELDILYHAGVLPPMPESMMQYASNGKAAMLDIEYTSPMTRAQRSEEGVAILNLLQAVNSIAQAKPDVLQQINFTKTVEELSEIYGVPVEILHSEEEINAVKEQQTNQQNMSSLLQAVPALANTSKTLAEAQDISSRAKW